MLRPFRYLHGTKVTTVASSLLVALVLVPLASAADGSSCRLIDARALPQRVSSGAWTPDGASLLVADPSLRRIMVYTANGRFEGFMPNPERVKAKFTPSRVATLDGEVIVEVEPRQLLRLDQRFRLVEKLERLAPQREISVAEGVRDGVFAAVPSGSGKLSIQSMFTYAFTQDEVISCSDLRSDTDGEESWSSAIVRFPIDNPDSFKVFKASPHTNPEWTFCRVGFPYVATIGETGFAILLGDQTGLYRNDPDSDSLTRLIGYPQDHLAAPTFPEFSSAGEFAAAMAEVEHSTMPVGLYAWSDHLFVLRRVVESGVARFLLDKVDPSTGQILETAELKSDAKELLLIPGRQWAMVEKLAFVSPTLPRIARIRLIPGAAFDENFGGVLCN